MQCLINVIDHRSESGTVGAVVAIASTRRWSLVHKTPPSHGYAKPREVLRREARSNVI